VLFRSNIGTVTIQPGTLTVST